ncbi:hypothetical protein J3Q64DRAFT_1818161 [Phycomyces blakesleeanus]|uniref:Uncharacterized protein n=1 Tax=Phycomyces blakesleeanus TaxID=4837 RepID=A0ABR3BJA3_PHYBL
MNTLFYYWSYYAGFLVVVSKRVGHKYMFGIMESKYEHMVTQIYDIYLSVTKEEKFEKKGLLVFKFATSYILLIFVLNYSIENTSRFENLINLIWYDKDSVVPDI